jgi:hypothetical protein
MGKRKEEDSLMPPDQERDLIWFLGPGSSAFEKSTCGPMLDALERDSCTSKSCAKCRGIGVLGGDDYTSPDYGAWCPKCGGTGTLPVAMKRGKVPLTARPKASASHSSGKTPADKTLTRYASISRRINRLQEAHPESVQILAAYYGNAGTRWAQTDGYSRMFPVIALTIPGATLIKRALPSELIQTPELDRGVPMEAHEQLGRLYELNKTRPDGGRGKLFADGFIVGEKLLNVAIGHWLETVKK